MNEKSQRIIGEYYQARETYERVGDLVTEAIERELRDTELMSMSVESRIKTVESLVSKLERKDNKYRHLSDITDILGVRIISYFSDDVDKIAACVERLFVIDRANSVDKRAQLNANAFGYLSVHYVASLPPDSGYLPELCDIKFEIQIRSILQHTWAEIEHDLGYKSEFGVPREIRRAFSRVAGLLELADEQFQQIRDGLRRYGDQIRTRIAANAADDVAVDQISLKEYMEHNGPMRAFLGELAAITGASITDISPENYLDQLAWLGKKDLGCMDRMLAENHDLALALARRAMSGTNLDALASNVALRYLCRAELLSKGYTEAQITEFMSISVTDAERAAAHAKRLLQTGHAVMAELKANPPAQ